MNHRHNVYVPDDVWEQARLEGINVSGFLTNHLIQELNMKKSMKSSEPAWQIELNRVSEVGRKGVLGFDVLIHVHNSYGVGIDTLEDFCKDSGILVLYD